MFGLMYARLYLTTSPSALSQTSSLGLEPRRGHFQKAVSSTTFRMGDFACPFYPQNQDSTGGVLHAPPAEFQGRLRRNNRHRIPQHPIQRRRRETLRSNVAGRPWCRIARSSSSIGQLVMSHDASANLVANTCQAALQQPEPVRAVGRHLGQRLHHVSEENRDLHHRRLHRQPHKPQLRQRTSCPPRLMILRKPPVRRQMVDMGRPRQSEQDIDIQQGNRHGYRPGSRNSRAASRSSLLAAAATSSGPNPAFPPVPEIPESRSGAQRRSRRDTPPRQFRQSRSH